MAKPPATLRGTPYQRMSHVTVPLLEPPKGARGLRSLLGKGRQEPLHTTPERKPPEYIFLKIGGLHWGGGLAFGRKTTNTFFHRAGIGMPLGERAMVGT